jgi:UDPglucose--hexose-1-phosphate uridylyltransferase
MGLAVLPSRLKQEMEQLADYLVRRDLTGQPESLGKHRAWAEDILARYSEIREDNVMDVLKEEIGQVFVKVLEDAGVYKTDSKGREAFERFMAVL